MSRLFAGIEAGGTKFVCAVGDSTGKIIDRNSVMDIMLGKH